MVRSFVHKIYDLILVLEVAAAPASGCENICEGEQPMSVRVRHVVTCNDIWRLN